MKTVPVAYHLCSRCWRAVPAGLREHYCPNDGALLLTACPRCSAPILSPYSRYCSSCGQAYTQERGSQEEARHPSGERRRA